MNQMSPRATTSAPSPHRARDTLRQAPSIPRESKITIRVPIELRSEFHTWCIHHGTSMNEVLTQLIEDHLDDTPTS